MSAACLATPLVVTLLTGSARADPPADERSPTLALTLSGGGARVDGGLFALGLGVENDPLTGAGIAGLRLLPSAGAWYLLAGVVTAPEAAREQNRVPLVRALAP